jgi:hypothetical protein
MVLGMSLHDEESIAAQKFRNTKKYFYALIALAAAALLFYIAALANASGSCNYIILQGSRYDCIYSAALASNSPQMCGSLPPLMSSECYSAIAESTLNSSLCASSAAANESYGSSCFLYVANATNNYKLCSGSLPQDRLACVLGISYPARNASMCYSLSNGTQKEECINTVAIGNAIESASPAGCSYLEGTMANVDIGMILSGFTINESEALVEEVSLNSSISSKDFCLAVAAIKQKNYTYCAGISNQYIAGVCYQQFTYNASQEYNSTQRNSTCAGNAYCSYFISLSNAVSSGNVSACGNLPEQLSYQCYSNIALNKGNFSICKLINNASVQYSCEFQAVYNGTSTNGS